MAAAWRFIHDTGSLDRTTMAAAVEELAVLGQNDNGCGGGGARCAWSGDIVAMEENLGEA